MNAQIPDRTTEASADEASGCVCFNFRKAARAVTQLYDATLEPSGLRATQFSLLTVLQIRRSVTISRLAREMVTDRTTLTRNLKPLEKRGLVTVVAGDKDRRTREVALTARGRKALATALPLWREAQSRAIGAVGRTRWKRLLSDFPPVVALVQHD